MTVGGARYWDGQHWTPFVSWGGTRLTDATPLEEVERRATLDERAAVNEYLEDAIGRGVVTREMAATVRDDLRRGISQPPAPESTGVRTAPSHSLPAPPPPPAPPAPVPLAPVPPAPAPAPAGPRWSTPPPTSPPTSPPAHGPTTDPLRHEFAAPEPAAVAPGRFSEWWDQTRETVRSELALHGIAYLGVLLLFAGVMGLIVFSFGDVAPWVRSVTELLVPAALFLSAWYLSSRDATVVGDALELLGGAVTPIVVVAAFTDGAPVPPDVGGRPLPIVQGLAVALVALAMAAVTRRRPSSPLRFLVGPIAWLAAGLAAGALRDPVPTGYDTARPDALQLAIILAAITLTVLAISLMAAPGALALAVRTVALPTAGVVYVLELVLAGDEGWPTSSTIVTGAAALALLEGSASRRLHSIVGALQVAVVSIAALRLSSAFDPQWIAVGAFATLLVLLEYIGRRRGDPLSIWFGLAAASAALLATLGESVTTAIGFGVLAIWGLWRYLAPADWLPIRDRLGAVPAVGAVGATAALWQMTDPGVAVVASSAAVLLLAVAGRIWKPISVDVLWGWFVPCSAAVVWLASFGYGWGSHSVEVGIAGVMASSALALSALPVAARVWASSGALVWALANFAEAFEISRDVQAIALGIGALVLVVIALALARPACVHLAAVGQLAGVLALAVPTWPGWAPTIVCTLAAAGWSVTTLIDDHGEAVHLGALRSVLDTEAGGPTRPIDITTELAGLAALALTMAAAGSAALAADPNVEPAVVNVAWAAGALLGAGAVRARRWTRARRVVFEWATFIGATLATITAIAETAEDNGDWLAIATAAIGLAVIATATAPRPRTFLWAAWVGGAAITLLVGDRLGLERDHLDSMLTGWGAAVLVGGVIVHRRRHGPMPNLRIDRDPATLPPIALGSAAVAVGGMSALSAGTDAAVGWTAAAMSVIVLTVALILPLGVLVAVAELLATVSYALLAPWTPLERPATFVPWVGALLLAAMLTRRTGTPWWPRWDLASFSVAHAVAGCALVLAVTTDTVATTFASFAVVSLGVAIVLRRFEWAIAAAVLLLIAGGDAGRGWLALVLVMEGLIVTVMGLRRTAIPRWAFLGVGAVALVGAWFDLVVWLDWSGATIVGVTVPMAAIVAFVAAMGLRTHLAPIEFAGVWTSAGALVSVGSMIVGVDLVPRLAGGMTFAGSVLLLAATAVAWVPLLGATMRWVAAGLAAIAWLPAAWAVGPSSLVATLVGTSVALAVLVFLLTLHGLQPTNPWIAPGSLYALATQALAASAALGALPATGPLALVVLALAAELVALGVINALPQLFVIAPAAACGAWVLVALDALAGEPNWVTVPIGITLLVMVGVSRWIRRGRGAEATTQEVVILELAGMTVVVASPIGEIVAGNLWNAVLAAALGVLLAGWGAVTRVRWRAAFGAATVAITIVLVIAVPLSTSVTWRGPALWLTLSLLGIGAIIVASALERGRAAVRQVGWRLDSMTEGWERFPRIQTPDASGHGPDAAHKEAQQNDTRRVP